MSSNDWPASYYAPAPTWPGQYQAPGPQQAWQPQAPPPRRGSGWGVALVVFMVAGALAVVLGALVGVRAGLGVLRDHTGRTFHRPESIGDATLVTTPEALRVADDMLADLDDLHRGVSGVYAGRSRSTLILIAGDSDDVSSRAMFDANRRDMRESGIALGAPRAFGTLTCGSVTGSAGRGVVCVWASRVSDGVVFHVGATDLGAVARETQEARAAVEA